MPSTRGSAKKRQTDTRPLSAHDIADGSPSKKPPAKKKKPNATAPRRARRPKTPEPESDEESDLDDDDASSEVEAQAIADKIIPLLEVAKRPVAVATHYHNSQNEGTGQTVQAFARLSGRDWTYYVHKANVILGRPKDADPHHNPSVGAESSPGTIPDADPDAVDIDLGPSKTISRLHAEIRFANDSQWHVEVKGRNGLKVNDKGLHCGQDMTLGSGDVLEIAGTQMMFVTAQGRLTIHPKFVELLDLHAEEEESARQDAGTHAHPEASYPAAPSSSSRLPPRSARVTSSQPNTQAAMAPAPPAFARPVTPVQSPKKSRQYSSAPKTSPAYGRGFVVESTEQIDYSSEAARGLKPSISYAVMITQAILSTQSESITLNGIYEWIKKNFAYYRYLDSNWQNSIRHNLSLHAGFTKIPRGPNEPGKGMKWHIVPEKRAELIGAVAKHMKKSNMMTSSAPNSPSALTGVPVPTRRPPKAPPQQYSSESNAESNAESNGIIKTSSPVHSTPLAAYPTGQESYTPSRGSRFTALPDHGHSHGLPVLSDDPSPLPIRHNNIRAGITDSSPVLTSGFYDNSMMTPAPRKYNLNAPLPNTVKLPTSHMPDSSPAPFWKYGPGSLLGSTPAKWPEISPLKAVGTLQSSSPPPEAANGNTMESPTRGRGGRSGATGFGSQNVDDEEGEIDILKGFKGIGQYHQERSTATVGNTA